MKFFYDPAISAETHTLTEEESKHCTRVLRLQKGDEIFITNGRGTLYRSQIADIDNKQTVVSVIETIENYNALPYYLHLAVAPTKNIDRIEWLLEKATEIGFCEFTPIICKNSERKIVKTDRLNRVVEAAMKQSYKAFHPQINDAITFADFLKTDDAEQKFIAHCEENQERKYLAEQLKRGGKVTIMIGPEGDFSIAEIAEALVQYKPITLGNSRLRTETAALVACDIVSIINTINNK